MDQIINFPKNFTRSLPYVIYASSLLNSLITGHQLGIMFTLSGLISDGINILLKLLFNFIDPTKEKWMRPAPPADGCGIFPVFNTNQSKAGGMPSGHAQMVTFAALFWLLYIWRHGLTTSVRTLLSTVIIIGLATLTMYSRISEGCHTFEQVLVGGILGGILGTGSFFLLENNQPQLFG